MHLRPEFQCDRMCITGDDDNGRRAARHIAKRRDRYDCQHDNRSCDTWNSHGSVHCPRDINNRADLLDGHFCLNCGALGHHHSIFKRGT